MGFVTIATSANHPITILPQLGQAEDPFELPEDPEKNLPRVLIVSTIDPGGAKVVCDWYREFSS